MTVFRLYNASMKDQLEKYHKEDHAKRYGTDANYKKVHLIWDGGFSQVQI